MFEIGQISTATSTSETKIAFKFLADNATCPIQEPTSLQVDLALLKNTNPILRVTTLQILRINRIRLATAPQLGHLPTLHNWSVLPTMHFL